MKRNVFLIGLILSIIFISGCIQQGKSILGSDDQQLPSIGGNTLETGQTITLRGLIKKGAGIGMDHCPEGFYLTDDTGLIQLRTSNINIGDYLDKEVEVSGNYLAAICEALICNCDDSMLVDTIKIIE